MRKIYFLTIAALGVAAISNAQISKGSTFLGGSVNFYNAKSKTDSLPENETHINNWGIRPQIGKAIATNKIVGVYLNYSSQKQEYNYSPTDKQKIENTDFGGGFFYRQYYSLSNRFYLFGESSIGIQVGKSERKSNDLLTDEGKTTEVGLALTPGISFAAGKKIHLEASLNSLLYLSYRSFTDKDFNTAGNIARTTKGNSFGGSVNANGFSGISIGIRWILPSKK